MAPRPRIFIIDDVPDNIDMLVHALDGMAEVRFALSGAQGLQHIREQVPDLVLLDVMMPVMNGYEVFAELQTNALTASIPVIFVTAKNDPLSETSALNAGAVDFIHKPINPAVVKARVTMHLNYQAREREVLQSHAELEQSRSQLLQSEKMAAVGQLAAGVAHEINNPIGFVSSNLGTLRQYVEQLFSLVDASDRFIQGCGVSEDAELGAARRRVDLPYLKEDLMALLTESRDGLERVKKIVLDLRNFSRIDSAGWHDADLNSGLDSTLNVAMHELKHKAEVVKHYAALPLVHCHPGQMNQVFLNLLVNASQAIADRGTVTLRSGVDGPWVWVSVADTGAGMTPETVSRIFEPFFTTKPVGEGTGLGLSLAYNIVKKHGGRIDVSSTPGTGSCFTVWLPLNTRKEAAA